MSIYPDASYISNAKALARLFPSLKKYSRRKRLSPQEKAAISRAFNVWEITQLPNEARPEQYRNYTYPANRKRSDKSYVKAAERLADFAPALKKYKGRKRLSPAEKAAIAYKEKRLRHVSDLTPLPEKTLEAIDSVAKRQGGKKARVSFPIPGVRAIKLRNIETPETPGVASRRIEATNYGMSVTVRYNSGVKRRYKFVYTGADRDAMIAAAERLFAEGARQVTVWLNHGRASESQPDALRFAAMIGDEFALSEIRAGSPSLAMTILSGGYAVIPDATTPEEGAPEPKERPEKLEAVPWIYGVMGIFETRPK